MPEAETAIRMNPNLPASYVNLGSDRGKKPKTARRPNRIFQKAVAIDPKFRPAILALGSLYTLQKRWPEAEKEFQLAITADPKSPTPRADLAEVYLLQGRRDEADHTMLAAKEALKDTRSGYRMLGDYYIAQGQNDKAFEEFASLHAKYPDDSSVANTYVQLLVVRNRLDEASKINEAVLKTSPSNAESLTVKGQILLKQGKPSEAVKVLERAVAGTPDSAVAHYYLGMAQAGVGDFRQAESEWNQAARLQPRMADAQRALAEAAIRRNDVQLLTQSAEQLISIEPGSSEGYVYRAMALLSTRDLAGAEHLTKAIENRENP